MAVYAYTGKLTDFSDAPVPDATAELYVEPERSAMSPTGPAATRRIPITVASDGTFSVGLVASVDLVPNTKYSLRCEWTDIAGNPAGWSQWDFTAQPGGGPIATMPGVMTRVWYSTTQPPVNVPGIYWIHPTTGDVKEWV